MAEETAQPVRPDHVPADRVYEYDLYEAPREVTSDYQIDIVRRLHREAPDIFWTPKNGGHWVVTRAREIDMCQRDGELFSMQDVVLPAGAKPFINIPLETDGPAHSAYRNVLQPAFTPARIMQLERDIRALAIELIEGFVDRGECEFVGEFSAILPIEIFMQLADLPKSDKADLMRWADASVHPRTLEERIWGYGQMSAYIEALMAERADGAREDVISMIMRGQVFDREMTHEERHSMILNVLLGGLDTVMATMGVIARFLATHPDHRRQLREDHALIPRAIDELMRFYGATGTARVVTRDIEHDGILFRKDDRILIQTMFHGQDERRFDNPDIVDFNRKDVRHATFGQGKHRCIGAMLARLEMRIFIEEWLQRIPEFDVAADECAILERGMVNSMRKLKLVWPRLG
ncbi:cytochrome P450 [Sphingobium sp. LMC3-1-1.1]|uniref:cytochrome P450 n=1 Tax=unclassified Sphingobium TaxID=2611147 RepID=UPI003448A22F